MLIDNVLTQFVQKADHVVTIVRVQYGFRTERLFEVGLRYLVDVKTALLRPPYVRLNLIDEGFPISLVLMPAEHSAGRSVGASGKRINPQ